MSLFRAKKSTPRRRSPRRRRRDHLLEVTATAETERRRRNQKVVLYSLEAAFGVGLLVVAWLGVNLFVEHFFTRNRDYDVRVVEVNTDGILSREEVLEKTGIHEGLNIFSLNLETAQAALTSVAEVKSAKVERILPDTVTIQIEARRPVAWVAPVDTGVDPASMETAALVDAQGVVVKPDGYEATHAGLPVIYGVSPDKWKPGERADVPALRSAIELFSLSSERNNPSVDLRAADISKGWCVLAWSEPKTLYTFGLDDLPAQLDRLQLIMLHVGQTSRKLATVNLIPERNTPVTFHGEVVPTEVVAGGKKN